MDYNAMTKEEMRALCAHRGLAVSRRDPDGKPGPSGKVSCAYLGELALRAQLEAFDRGDPPPFGYAKGRGGRRKTATPTTVTPPTTTVVAEPTAVVVGKPDPKVTEPPHKKSKPTTKKEATTEQVNLRYGLRMFFSEFHFMPNLRFISTLVDKRTKTDAVEFVNNYFRLTNHPQAADISEKMKSAEAKRLVDQAISMRGAFGTKPVNSRLEIYFGSPGGGKTYNAIEMAREKYPDADVVLCDPEMTPEELILGLDFEVIRDADGKPTGSCPVFKGSELRTAMEEGRPIVLDEMNLLSRSCQQKLQGVTDGKDEFSMKGYKVHIKDGFRIIGTLNLSVSGETLPIIEPLVDRAAVIKEVELSDKELMDILVNLP